MSDGSEAYRLHNRLPGACGPGALSKRRRGGAGCRPDRRDLCAGLAGINLGEFTVTAAYSASAYEMAADGRFSLLAGLLYKATGKTTSNGRLTEESPQPARYTLSYEDSKKSQQLRMSFAGGAVSDVKIVPHKKPNPRDLPVTAEQLKGVLDPLTAAFLSVRSDAPPGDLKVCGQTIKVFDGRQRFNIALTPKRTETLGRGAPKGLSARVAVCRVRYEPIGGYRPDHPGVQFMQKTDEVEAWLVSVPGTEFYVPYKVLVPTAWGTGTVTLTDMKVAVGAQRAAAP
ncbi:hypothetical protein AUC71_14805 [Methyloceanibacter marginalis]|uniref:DUF3108 domain-containing protein n=1 Tax=Methyloceanibacter marginalis TaxID=1774971 RepID=A0A1E3W9N0_9HYPH|nr:DUF3108 domain-containing protein [Methyloceanibacter marginalis]ODS02524.1 hypothetical protein AUC71_14805 [Methyloceanibacter marginalis]